MKYFGFIHTHTLSLSLTFSFLFLFLFFVRYFLQEALGNGVLQPHWRSYPVFLVCLRLKDVSQDCLRTQPLMATLQYRYIPFPPLLRIGRSCCRRPCGSQRVCYAKMSPDEKTALSWVPSIRVHPLGITRYNSISGQQALARLFTFTAMP